jgi:hypothetical protein
LTITDFTAKMKLSLNSLKYIVINKEVKYKQKSFVTFAQTLVFY